MYNLDEVISYGSKTCEFCLNAYTNDHVLYVWCCNKDWRSQFEDIDIKVSRYETCDLYTPRRKDQVKLNFNKVKQLELF